MKNSNFNPHNKLSIIRIAPVCNGKIYVVPHAGSNQMDLPLMKYTDSYSRKTCNKTAKLFTENYKEFTTSEEPRFSVRYISPVDKEEFVYLYILPLNNEDEVVFNEGKFISADDIENNQHLYSESLQKESGLLGLAAELWRDYL